MERSGFYRIGAEMESRFVAIVRPARGRRTQSLRDATPGENRSAPQWPLRGRAEPVFALRWHPAETFLRIAAKRRAMRMAFSTDSMEYHQRRQTFFANYSPLYRKTNMMQDAV